MIITGNGIELYRLIVLQSGLELELQVPGMRMSRHMTALQAAKRITGLKTNDRAKHLTKVCEMIDTARANLNPGDITA
jgi:hypothetical protein